MAPVMLPRRLPFQLGEPLCAAVSDDGAFDSEAAFDGKVLVVLYISRGDVSQMSLPLHPDFSPTQRGSQFTRGAHK